MSKLITLFFSLTVIFTSIYPEKIYLKPPQFESKIETLMDIHSGKRKLEASGIILVNGFYYIIFDNTFLIAKIHKSLSERKKANAWLGNKEKKSGFEGITYDYSDQKFLIVEELKNFRKSNLALVHEYKEGKGYLGKWVVEFPIKSRRKGMEGISYFRNNTGEYLALLCEKAKCSKRGNVLILKKEKSFWKEVSAFKFKVKGMKDYSDISIKEDKVAIVSQQSSSLWIGKMNSINFQFTDGKLYHFPKVNTNGEFSKEANKKTYCAVEGVTWVDEKKLAMVSDQTKKDKSGFCHLKDEMLHIFTIP
ncbi:MAG: hypothetical protein KDK36_11895 [Leptospiraceae bacterium]|nr:hypothetical protein [Leptospiraceae bacterium]